ncbi:hypothetical protein [Hymenobacter metallilatus]|uniref:Uncharacterized protein n=1 Tax=Hymenobacter metallilatus TaxID=2493666 RepID=A0A428IYV7_9BACT|nr:hypothetical protein [Hymenobacter metallilatus]RSK24163.1 hypothetical protein EI290_20490 [Hymenobacter metallilatus]
MFDRMHSWLVVAVSLMLLYAGLKIVSVQVNMQYETHHDPCFSVVTGRNLCTDYQAAKWATAGIGVLLLGVIGFSNQLIRKK